MPKVEDLKSMANKLRIESLKSTIIASLIAGIVPNIRYLCIRDIPRSGKPEELRKKFGIDKKAIVKLVKQII